MSVVFRCEVCDTAEGLWRIERSGDAAVTWSCQLHLERVCQGLIRGWEAITTLTLRWRSVG